MAFINIPSRFRGPLFSLATASEKDIESLHKALAKAKVSLSPKDLIEAMSVEEIDFASCSLEEVVGALLSINTACTQSDIPIDEFIVSVTEALKRDYPDLGEEANQKFIQRLGKFLSPDEVLGMTAKIGDVLTEHQRTFQDARVLTDLRPVFWKDVSSGPANFILVHSLKIVYQEAGEFKEFYLALDADDLKKLESTIVRAQSKAESTKKVLKSSNINVMDVE